MKIDLDKTVKTEINYHPRIRACLNYILIILVVVVIIIVCYSLTLLPFDAVVSGPVVHFIVGIKQTLFGKTIIS